MTVATERRHDEPLDETLIEQAPGCARADQGRACASDIRAVIEDERQCPGGSGSVWAWPRIRTRAWSSQHQ